MIKTFKSKGLATLWEAGKSKIDNRMHRRILIRLAVINEAASVEEMNLPDYITSTACKASTPNVTPCM